MNQKTKNTLRWVSGGLIALLFIGSSIGKFNPNPEMLKMGEGMGLNADTFKIIGIVEVLSAILFLIPRTGVLGTLLLAAYMGGAIATHLEHGQSILMPAAIQAVLWIVAVFRFPELCQRICSK